MVVLQSRGQDLNCCWNLMKPGSQIATYESPTLCFLIIAGTEDEKQWHGVWGGAEDARCKMEGQQNCYHGYKKYINGSQG